MDLLSRKRQLKRTLPRASIPEDSVSGQFSNKAPARNVPRSHVACTGTCNHPAGSITMQNSRVSIRDSSCLSTLRWLQHRCISIIAAKQCCDTFQKHQPCQHQQHNGNPRNRIPADSTSELGLNNRRQSPRAHDVHEYGGNARDKENPNGSTRPPQPYSHSKQCQGGEQLIAGPK